MEIFFYTIGLFSIIYETSMVLIFYNLILTYFLLDSLSKVINERVNSFLDFLLFNLINLSGFVFSIQVKSILLLYIVSIFEIMYIISNIYIIFKNKST